MRKARITADGSAYYHCMSRIIERRFVLGAVEKEKLRTVMRKLEVFCGVEILTYTILDNHWHILLKVPAPCDVSDNELIRRLGAIYEPYFVKQVALQLEDFRKAGHHECAEELKARYTYRMHNVSEYFKTLKQCFSQWYNYRNRRHGPLWEQRFKSILVEGSDQALFTIAAYIDLNAIRAGLVSDPEDYRYCGYGEAMGGLKAAQDGIRHIMQTVGSEASWARIRCLYRKHMYIQGGERGVDTEGKPIRAGFSKEQVEKVLSSGGKLQMRTLLRCRVRYFSDGLALGSKGFVEEIFNL